MLWLLLCIFVQMGLSYRRRQEGQPHRLLEPITTPPPHSFVQVVRYLLLYLPLALLLPILTMIQDIPM